MATAPSILSIFIDGSWDAWGRDDTMAAIIKPR